MVFLERGIEALLSARVDACKMAPSRSPTMGTFVRQSVSGTKHQGSESPCSCFVCRSSSQTHYLTHEDRGPLLTTQPRSKGQRPASPCEPNSLNMNTRIVQSSSCVKGKPATKPRSHRPPPNYILSRLHASLAPHSCFPPHTDIMRVLSRSLTSD